MKKYRSRQSALLILVAMGLMAATFLALGLTTVPAFLVALPILVLVGVLFSSMTIEVADGALRWKFGPGLIRKEVALAEIASATPVRTSFFEGWGIHYSRFGWLYNVSGFGAVAVTLKNGKRFALGSNEPEKLAQAIGQAKG